MVAYWLSQKQAMGSYVGEVRMQQELLAWQRMQRAL